MFGSLFLPAGILQYAAVRPAESSLLNTLYVFQGSGSSPPDGESPQSLTYWNGDFYGTTSYGGAFCATEGGCGTVFEASPSGGEVVLHSFSGSPDGSGPQSALVFVKGAFYGTTNYGGAFGQGTLFEVTPSGAERVLHSFGSGKDGALPCGNIAYYNGVLYGTTTAGGANGTGTVFAANAAGLEHVLYSFRGGADGAGPGGLVFWNGDLFGTTESGGTYGQGTVFRIFESGQERVLYSFKGGKTDGANPYFNAALTILNGELYGTTEFGGPYGIAAGGAGTVFAVSTSGRERVLHFFGSGVDGAWPQYQLVVLHGTLYGTTFVGGLNDTACSDMCGTIFAISPSGAERILYAFQAGSDGLSPAVLVSLNGVLYGTTYNGGVQPFGVTLCCGTIFEIPP